MDDEDAIFKDLWPQLSPDEHRTAVYNFTAYLKVVHWIATRLTKEKQAKMRTSGEANLESA